MQSFMEFLHESTIVDLVEALSPGEVWGLYNGKYVPCDAKTMKVLRGAYKGMTAKPVDHKNQAKTPLPDGQRWQKVGADWVILDKTDHVVGGAKIHKGKWFVDGRLITDAHTLEVNGRKPKRTPSIVHYGGSYTRDPRLQKYWNDRGDGPEGMWHWSGGRMREIDEPED